MSPTSANRSGLEDSPFSYQETAQGKVLISWRGKQVLTLKGARAGSFLARISRVDAAEQQMIMAKVTGNFKRGNEQKY